MTHIDKLLTILEALIRGVMPAHFARVSGVEGCAAAHPTELLGKLA